MCVLLITSFASYRIRSQRQLLRDPDVLFAGYKVPHPLIHEVMVKVQTTHSSSPVASLTTSISDLISELSLLEERFNTEVNRKKQREDMYL